MRSPLLGGLSPEAFMKKHWQKKPLLVRQAFPDFADPLSPDELAGLATEPGCRARLVQEKGGPKPWTLEHGPFKTKRLKGLPPSHWTLLVSDVNQYVDAAAAMLDRFSFVPHWRMDDLMVSFASKHGTVGPHVDSYDVFLVQGMGRRRWQISRQKDQTFRPNLPLKILRKFEPEAEWILAPGDMLYLPPGYAHHGVALEPCMTYSVGFRAPRRDGLLKDLFNLPDEWLQDFGDELYADPELPTTARPGELSPAAMKKIATMVSGPLTRPDVLGRWFAAYSTRPRSDAAVLPAVKRAPPALLARRLAAGGTVWRTDLWRIAYLRLPGGDVAFFAGGVEYVLPKGSEAMVEELSGRRAIDAFRLSKALPRAVAKRTACLAFLADLTAKGVLDLGISQD